jgi:hypothetical protein
MNKTTLEIISVITGSIVAIAAVIEIWKKNNPAKTTNNMFKQRDNNNSQILQAGDGATQIINNYSPILLQNETKTLSRLTVQEIYKEIKDRPPLQRDSIAKHYIGQVVVWKAYMRSLKEDTIYLKNNTHLQYIQGYFHTQKDSGDNSFFARIDIKYKKCLEIIKTGAIFIIKGRVSDADTFTVSLDNCEILSIDGEEVRL